MEQNQNNNSNVPAYGVGNADEIKKILERMLTDRDFRVAVTGRSFSWFVPCYFPDRMSYAPAPMHYEMHQIIESDSSDLAIVMAFRGSGKTTLFAELYPIWAVTGKQKKKHVVIFGKTLAQAKQYLRNIKDQLDGNPLLRNDLGPFREEDDWNSFSLVIPNYNARITAASAEQSVRGIKHGAFRPDLCILDDCEDVASVRTQEARNATYEWVTRNIFPLGDKTTRFIVIWNLLHDDSLLMRLIREIEEGKRSGAYKRYPLIAENDTVLWPGKYAGIKDVIKERLRVGNEIAWQREYLLNIVPDED